MILNCTGKQGNVPVKYDLVSSRYGKKRKMKTLGWKNFASCVNSAVRDGYVLQTKINNEKWISLSPKAPFPYKKLVDAILAINGGVYGAPVKFVQVAANFGGNQACQALGWETFTSYTDSAASENCVVLTYAEDNKLIAVVSSLRRKVAF